MKPVAPRRHRSAARAHVQAAARTRDGDCAIGTGAMISQIAMQAGVSRATAYRYFPTRSTLVAAMVRHSLGPVRNWRGGSGDGRGRVAELFDQTFPRFKEYEPQLRAAVMIAVEHQLRERAGLLERSRTVRLPRRHSRACGRTAQAHARSKRNRAFNHAARDGLRHRSVCDLGGYLRRERSQGRNHRAMDGAGAGRCRVARCT